MKNAITPVFNPLRLYGMLLMLLALFTLALPARADDDPPGRVARLGFVSGLMSFSPAGEDEWVNAGINRPLTQGDRLWVDGSGRAELDMGNAAIRLDGLTSLSILNLDDRTTQLQLAQGVLNVTVRSLQDGEFVEIDTPTLAVTLRQSGSYRIAVDAYGNATTVGVRAGQAEVTGEGPAYLVNPGQSYHFTGANLRDYLLSALAVDTDFDRWSSERERQLARSTSARYVSPEVIGYQELDTYGSWREEAEYGSVWVPNRVAVDWAPYQDGRWAWVQPWGWTWIDNAPWGFAPSHYGRWVHTRGNWCWVPGPRRDRPVYAPALVVFIGGPGFRISAGGPGVGWFPLGPRDVYRPPYNVSRGYFTRVNISNTRIPPTQVSSHYDDHNPAGTEYVNRRVPGAVTAVPTSAFGQNQSVTRAAMRVPMGALSQATVTTGAAIAPTHGSVTAGAAPGQRPPEFLRHRPVVTRTPPPTPPASFAAQESLLINRAGRPLDSAERARLQGNAPQPAITPPVRTVQPTPPGMVGPPAPPNVAGGNASNDNDARSRRGQPGERQPPNQAAGPMPAQQPAAAPVHVNSPAPTVPMAGPPAQPRARPDPATRSPEPAAPVVRPPEAATPAAPAPQERRGMERRERPDAVQRQPEPQPHAAPQPQPRARVATPEAPVRSAAPTPTPTPTPTPPAPAVQPRAEQAGPPQATRAPGAERKIEEERKKAREEQGNR
jgi:hypothetical protein